MMDLNTFINNGIQNIADTAGRFYLDNRKGQTFLLKMASVLRTGAKRRDEQERHGVHIPPFLIASIASSCNLRCTGCYARANGCCSGEEVQTDMKQEDWQRVFAEATELGVSFILLAGGEPLTRPDVIELAAEQENIIFPIFTNGTLIRGDYLALFDRYRNLIPVLSIEGDAARTDARRGAGVGALIERAISAFKDKGILFGASITVTSENMESVTDSAFVQRLRESGCGLVFYVEYVPAEQETDYLVMHSAVLEAFQVRLNSLREDRNNHGMILLSFPGDEEKMGGCLAAGRGFFHVNAQGGAEPCPFSPYSELSLQSHTILEVLQSPFMEKVREISAVEALNHHGGCTLFQHKNEVKQALV